MQWRKTGSKNKQTKKHLPYLPKFRINWKTKELVSWLFFKWENICHSFKIPFPVPRLPHPSLVFPFVFFPPGHEGSELGAGVGVSCMRWCGSCPPAPQDTHTEGERKALCRACWCCAHWCPRARWGDKQQQSWEAVYIEQIRKFIEQIIKYIWDQRARFLTIGEGKHGKRQSSKEPRGVVVVLEVLV